MAAIERLLIISGLSGAGKTIALHALEDADFYCVDNLPAGILPTLIRHLNEQSGAHFKRVAVGIDARNHEASIRQLPGAVASLRQDGIPVELLFIDARDEKLTMRFSETRRKHPLSDEATSLTEAIRLERSMLNEVALLADLRVDTTTFNVHELRATIRKSVAGRTDPALAIQFQSFGFKSGVPVDADFVFDARCLPNPYWQDGLRDLTGQDAAVCSYFSNSPAVEEFISSIADFLAAWIPRFEMTSRSYLTVAIGCTGGRHRSVYTADRLAQHFRAGGKKALISHRDL